MNNWRFVSWSESFGDRVTATATLDQILHHAITKATLKAGMPAEEPTT